MHFCILVTPAPPKFCPFSSRNTISYPQCCRGLIRELTFRFVTLECERRTRTIESLERVVTAPHVNFLGSFSNSDRDLWEVGGEAQ